MDPHYSLDTVNLIVQMAALNAVITPIAVMVVTQSHWRSEIKAVLALIVCVLSGVFAVVQGGQHPMDLVVAIPIALGAMQLAYEKYWKASNIAPWIAQYTDVARQVTAGATKTGPTRITPPS